jgi:Txe/YoeB family toxin of Txe-Axe toxin-antitoxin module
MTTLTPASNEKLVGDPEGAYAKRIDIHHRLVYAVPGKARKVRVLRMWPHHE